MVHLKHIIFAKYFATDIHVRQLVPLPANLSHFSVANVTCGGSDGRGVASHLIFRTLNNSKKKAINIGTFLIFAIYSSSEAKLIKQK